jgi:hypothetical protein
MEGYCSTGQSPQRAVLPMEKEEVMEYPVQILDGKLTSYYGF